MFGDLVVNLVARINRFTQPVQQARGMLTSFRAAAASAVSGISSAFGRLAGVGSMVSGAIGGLSAGAALKSFADAGSALNDMSVRTGASVESLSSLSFAAQQTGTDMGSVEAGIKKLDNAMTDAIAGNAAASKMFTSLGLDAQTLIDMPLDQRLNAIGAAMAQIENPSIRGAAAVDLFGKSGRDLIPMLLELGDLQARSSELGLGWTTEDAELADAVGDRMDEILAVMQRIVQTIGAEMAPTFLAVTDSINTWMPATREWFSWLITAASDLYKTLAFVFGNFGELASLTLQQVGLYFVTLGNDIAHFFTGTMPAALRGFVDYATSLMGTLLDNIKGKMSDVKSVLTGGSATHTWKSLADVEFKMNGPGQRQQTDLERSMAKSIAETQSRLGDAYNANESVFQPKPAAAVPKKAGPLFFDEESIADAKSKADDTNAKLEKKRNKVNSDWQGQVDRSNSKAREQRAKELAGEMKPAKLDGAIGVRTNEAYKAIVAAANGSRGSNPQEKQVRSLDQLAKIGQEQLREQRRQREWQEQHQDQVIEDLAGA